MHKRRAALMVAALLGTGVIAVATAAHAGTTPTPIPLPSPTGCPPDAVCTPEPVPTVSFP
ncbi:hypothetical protein Aple_026650 [Acrocarpospora pleiomorpha]|uniref:Uncharacterized protein n=1 Tax=Acrocarpospora pleiomorpha TaxID=90975 RepID=A0A5M3XHS8_9ACTN|nr:hypothetical protein [Acrocarpospora pleiomorpha]GES19769.1 hypothetical protein Aple_026650 [Acrocarpospora pleiomorpha]